MEHCRHGGHPVNAFAKSRIEALLVNEDQADSVWARSDECRQFVDVAATGRHIIVSSIGNRKMTADLANAAAFIDYARKYPNAFTDISDASDRLPASVHVIGHGIELALKGYLAATIGEWPGHHDLSKLARKATEQGLNLSDKHAEETIPLVSKRYYKPGKYKWKYPSRYPITGLSAWVEPSRDQLADLVNKIIGQTKQFFPGS